MTRILYFATTGPADATRASLPLHLAANGSAGALATLVYIPPEVRGEVAASGGASQATETRPNGSRLVTAAPSGGPFSISVAPAPLVLSACG